MSPILFSLMSWLLVVLGAIVASLFFLRNMTQRPTFVTVARDQSKVWPDLEDRPQKSEIQTELAKLEAFLVLALRLNGPEEATQVVFGQMLEEVQRLRFRLK